MTRFREKVRVDSLFRDFFRPLRDTLRLDGRRVPEELRLRTSERLVEGRFDADHAPIITDALRSVLEGRRSEGISHPEVLRGGEGVRTPEGTAVLRRLGKAVDRESAEKDATGFPKAPLFLTSGERVYRTTHGDVSAGSRTGGSSVSVRDSRSLTERERGVIQKALAFIDTGENPLTVEDMKTLRKALFQLSSERDRSVRIAAFLGEREDSEVNLREAWTRLSNWFEENRDRIEELGISAPERLAEQPVDNLVSGLMLYLDNGQPGKRGRASEEDRPVIEMIIGGLTSFRPANIEERLWERVVEICAKKWVRTEGLGSEDFNPMERRGWKLLAAKIGEKIEGMTALVSRSLLTRIIYRHSVETVREVTSEYDSTLAGSALKSGGTKPAEAAIEIASARDAAREVAAGHESKAIRSIAPTIAYATAGRGIKGEDAGRDFARQVIEAAEAARGVAAGHESKAIRSIAPTIATVTAGRGIKGRKAGEAFARQVIEAAKAARGIAAGHDSEAIRSIAPTIATVTARSGIKGEDAGRDFARQVIEAANAAREVAAGDKSKAIRSIAPTIAHATANRGIKGREAGRDFAREVIEAANAAREVAAGDKSKAIRSIATTIATATARSGIKGEDAGRDFAREVIEAAEAAREVAAGDKSKAIQSIAPTIATVTAGRGIKEREAGRDFAREVIEAANAAREVAAGDKSKAIRSIAPTIAHATANRGIKGEEAGERFANKIIRKILTDRKDVDKAVKEVIEEELN